MIREIQIRNFKSITDLTLPLGRITVLIGANGSGKSNILEAITIGSAAANHKLDNEFLASRGIRVPDDPCFMRTAFDKNMADTDISLSYLDDKDDKFIYTLQKDNRHPYSPWEVTKGFIPYSNPDHILREEEIRNLFPKFRALIDPNTNLNGEIVPNLNELQIFRLLYEYDAGPTDLLSFRFYSPENSALQTFEAEGQILPLGIRGQGLFKLLRILSTSDRDAIKEIKEKLALIDWFSDFDIAGDLAPLERSLRIRDRFLDDDLAYFDQKSANEGFLFLLFYYSLFISKDTPTFFAVDNVDASLNPKLCSQLMTDLVQLADAHGKQAIFTTHNPAVLDGLDLTDDEQRLFVVSRNRNGHTRIRRVPPPQVTEGQTPVRLSEAFLRGYLGGLPDNF